MFSDSLLAIANLLLPEILVTYFDLTKQQIKGEELHFYFMERAVLNRKKEWQFY